MTEVKDAPTKIARYVWSTDTGDGWDDDICDEVCTDRLTGKAVIRYDAADPANTNPAYGGLTNREYLERKGLDPDAEIDISESKVAVRPDEPAAHAAGKARKAQREKEEDEAEDLLGFLGDAAAAFDFGRYADDEVNILLPALEARGFTRVAFYMLECDSFGPLMRGCVAYDQTGKRVRFFYG